MSEIRETPIQIDVYSLDKAQAATTSTPTERTGPDEAATLPETSLNDDEAAAIAQAIQALEELGKQR